MKYKWLIKRPTDKESIPEYLGCYNESFIWVLDVDRAIGFATEKDAYNFMDNFAYMTFGSYAVEHGFKI